jgi:predicted dehydrogenase
MDYNSANKSKSDSVSSEGKNEAFFWKLCSAKERVMNVVRVAIVGCGRISDLHELGYRERRDARIVAVCDTKAGRARAKARAWGVEKVYTDYQKLLSDPDVDLVELLVPHHLHAEMTVAACEAGKHVSVQKPMALTVAEADRMIAAAKSAGVVLRVYENFVFYEPHVRARQMIDAGEIGEPQMIRLHCNSGSRDAGWKVPLSAWLWRISDKKCGGGPLVFDHGYHLFSLALYLMGQVERVYAWMDTSPVGGMIPNQIAEVDAPATIMFRFKSPRRYGVLDFAHTPNIKIESLYYTDDNRVEVIGDKGILFVNRCTARTVDLPELMMFRDGKTTPIEVEEVEWHDSFMACTRHLIDVLRQGGQPVLDGPTGKAVLQFTLAAHISAREGREVRPDDVG